ncbi:hypothetical protein, variant [Cladophialophora immunda]|uniref:Uncharacterized protein n=1 Tax=Cladophialophora immunda TaxID=569365 RepID=A0A0D2CKT8_9EURO|nr:uncharacterized protein PV07_06400 [Cladophialophora immunda]XP_016250896.1 hypothetical protein, variant [Cladophialophora immunda]KIW30679.1 hypothetical protein PV07_06400 [Cladophialophora immunda]KIW30680.1 hypothetical protein, variant [Cladophialophora immunda]OQU99485.1 hypothetical protein CLAIMM_05113 isoform 1 [Cladophialophora immunda]OQU99486.1 hypothetical protein CLAIMM_05113 isoform 2 [Cladophialophora immunda]
MYPRKNDITNFTSLRTGLSDNLCLNNILVNGQLDIAPQKRPSLHPDIPASATIIFFGHTLPYGMLGSGNVINNCSVRVDNNRAERNEHLFYLRVYFWSMTSCLSSLASCGGFIARRYMVNEDKEDSFSLTIHYMTKYQVRLLAVCVRPLCWAMTIMIDCYCGDLQATVL